MHGLYDSLIPHAVAVALSPLPIAALIFLLLSNKPKANSVGFLAGWFTALIINVSLFAFLFGVANVPKGGDPVGVKVFDIILGVILILFALNEWKGIPKKGQKAKVPKWMQAVANFNPAKSFLIAASLVTINAKNTVLDVAVGNVISQNTTSSIETLTAIIVFSFVASLSILIPVVLFLVFGSKLKGALNGVNGFFIKNSNFILAILFFLLGVSLVVKAF